MHLPDYVEDWLRRGTPSYNQNNLVTWHQSMDFLRNPRFLRAYARGMDSGHQIMREPGSRADIHIEWRVMMACWAGWHASRLPGDFVECGVNTGIVSLAVCDYVDFNSLDKAFYLFDTFSGIPEDMMLPEEKEARTFENKMMYPECYELAKRNFSAFPRAVLVRGKVPESLSELSISKVSYLHLDMNAALPERAAIEHFWPKMALGGVILLDDYGWAPYHKQKETIDEFAAMQGVEIMMLPTGHGLLIRS
jgi:O-methyltransferase